MSGFTAPVAGSGKTKLETAPVPAQMHLVTFYGLIDLGTQTTKFGPKRQVQLLFEVPGELRKFYESDDELKPCSLFSKMSLSMHQKAELRKNYVQPMINRKLTDPEAETFDISSLLGKHFCATVRHDWSGENLFENIASITPINNQNALMFNLDPNNIQVQTYNPPIQFSIDKGFDSKEFAELPYWLRNKLKESTEGLAFAAAGGVFAEPVQDGNNQNTARGGNNQPGAPQARRELRLTNKAEFSLEQYREAKWTDDYMVEQGVAEYYTPAPPAQPVTQQPQQPQQPQQMSSPASPVAAQQAEPASPMNTVPGSMSVRQSTVSPMDMQATNPQAAPAAPAAPVQAQAPVLKLKDPKFTLEQWKAQNWTEQGLVDAGHAVWENFQ